MTDESERKERKERKERVRMNKKKDVDRIGMIDRLKEFANELSKREESEESIRLMIESVFMFKAKGDGWNDYEERSIYFDNFLRILGDEEDFKEKIKEEVQ